LRNLRFKTSKNIIEENNYSEENNLITTKNIKKSEILIMDAKAQVQVINNFIQVIKEIGTFENNVTTPLTFYEKNEENPYEFLK